MPLAQSLTFATLIFGLAIFGLVTRRSFRGQVLSLCLAFCAVAYVAAALNRAVRVDDTRGLYFAAILLVALIAFVVMASKFRTNPSAKADTSASDLDNSELAISPAGDEGYDDGDSLATSRHPAYRLAGIPFQVTALIGLVMAFLMLKVTWVGLVGFVFGVVALLWILKRRISRPILAPAPQYAAPRMNTSERNTLAE